MNDSNNNNKKHFSAEQITSAISNKESWIETINDITGSSISGIKSGEPCPVCGTGNNRFVFDDSRGRGNNLCRKCDGGEGKSAKSRTGLTLIADILNCSFDEACEKVGNYLSLTPDQRMANAAPRRQLEEYKKPEISEKEKNFAAQMIEKALNGATDVSGTLGQDYLKKRGLKVDYPIHNLRFNKIERYEKNKNPKSWQQNALIARLTNNNGKLESLQRIYLNEDATKDIRKQTSKYTGHSNEEAKASVKLFDPAEIMGIAEGAETALAAHELSGIPVWAAINAGRLACWQPPEIAKTIFIFADLDQSNTGYECAVKLYLRLQSQGYEVYLLMPGTIIPQGKTSIDFLDYYNSVRGMTFSISQLKSIAIEVIEEEQREENENEYQTWKSQAPIIIFPAEQVKTNATSGRQTPKPTLDNLSRLMDYYKVQLKYNEINKQPEYTFPNTASFINEGEDLKANAAHGQIIDLMTINNMPISNLDAYLQTLQQKHTYNPVKEWVNSKPWNGHNYIQDLLDTVEINTTTTDKPKVRLALKNILIKKWLLGSCALALDIINEFPFVLTFQSNKQGIGKTYWFRKLCPPEYRVDGVTLDLSKPDSEREALSHWLCELGEVDGTIRKSSMDSMKAFLSRTKDILRTPYAKYANVFKRRTAFFGTCNPTYFLRDDENRRFWVLPVNKVDSYHNIDMQQVWAQCLHLIKNGETHLLTTKESQALTRSNEEFLPEHIIDSSLRETFDFNDENKKFRKLTPQEILKESGFSSAERQRYARSCGSHLQKAFGEGHRSNGKTWYYVPPLLPSNMGGIDLNPLGDQGDGSNLDKDDDIPW